MNNVTVIDQKGQALGNCTEKRARILIERGHAKITSYIPFSIQLQKDITAEDAEMVDTSIPMHPGTIHLCVSNNRGIRTECFLNTALRLAKKQTNNVLYISTLYNEHSLNRMVTEKCPIQEYPFEHFTLSINPSLSNQELLDMFEKCNPDVLFVDEAMLKFDEAYYQLLKETCLSKGAILVLGSYTKVEDRMPTMRDLKKEESKLEITAASIVAYYGNQCTILKNRFGSTHKGHAFHRKHLTYQIEEYASI